MASPQFQLRAELAGHEDDVRGVCVSELGLITGSRDKTVRVWAEGAAPSDMTCVATLVGHTDFVVPVACVPALGAAPRGLIVSGSRDKSVRLWDADSASCVSTLTGHEQQVACLAVGPDGEIYSGALDSTIRVWRRGPDGGYVAAGELRGHGSSVLSLLLVPGTAGAFELLSGSGDTTIKRWSGGVCIETLKAHTDTVRGLALLPGVGFVSASHDMSARVWSFAAGGSSPALLSELLGHTALLYAAAGVQTPSGALLVATGSEDDTARIWTPSGECLQVIEHPGCVWAVAWTPAGDMVSGCSDARTRLWTAAAERVAPQEVSAAFATRMAVKAEAKSQAAAAAAENPGLPPGVKVSEASALLAPGSKDGAQLFVKEAGAIVAYTWDAARFTWDKLGEVVAAPGGGGGGKKWHAGREWDFVFDVEMDDGAPRKLAIDRDENPYLAAERFLAEEGLPPYFKEQIVQFIAQFIAQATGMNTGMGVSGSGSGSDPSFANMPITGGGCDPFTGGASSSSAPPMPRPDAYAPQMSLASMPITGGGLDPLTGGGSDSAGASGRPAAAMAAHAPASSFLVFDTLPNRDALARKLAEFSEVLRGSGGAAAAAALSAEELAPGGALETLLARLPAVASSQAGSQLMGGQQELALLARLAAWPAAQLFPALDVLRSALLDGAAARALAGAAGDFGAAAPGTLSGALSTAAAASPPVPAALQLGLRLAANAFKNAPAREWLMSPSVRGPLLDAFLGPATAPELAGNKAVRLSLATLLYNMAVALYLNDGGSSSSGSNGMDEDVDEARLQVLSALLDVVGRLAMVEEEDAAYRTLVALGTLVAGHKGSAGLAMELGLSDALRRAQTTPGTSSRLLAACIDVAALVARARGA